jgi:hypothetical protein
MANIGYIDSRLQILSPLMIVASQIKVGLGELQRKNIMCGLVVGFEVRLLCFPHS